MTDLFNQPKRIYYNTTNESPVKEREYTAKANTQDGIVLGIIKTFNKPFSSKDVYAEYPVPNTPLSSIRRSINTLMNFKKIAKTGARVTGPYGRSEEQYKLL